MTPIPDAGEGKVANMHLPPANEGAWRGVPMNSSRLYTIWVNRRPRPTLRAFTAAVDAIIEEAGE